MGLRLLDTANLPNLGLLGALVRSSNTIALASAVSAITPDRFWPYPGGWLTLRGACFFLVQGVSPAPWPPSATT
jgi:hypothetical protein